MKKIKVSYKDIDNVGLVKPQKVTLYNKKEEKLTLEVGVSLKPVEVVFETYGKLNKSKTNVILLCHALSGDSHAAGFHSENDKKPGWWDMMIGPGKAIDTNKYFVICQNFLGSCYGTTGPASIDPETNKPYGLNFPIITISDMVNVQKKLLDELGIKKIFCVIGGSIGGMQVLQWTVSYPEMVENAIPIATTSKLSPQCIAFNEVERMAIMMDSNWNQGNYYDSNKKPQNGLALARMIGHITYLSDEKMQEKFSRNLQDKNKYDFNFKTEFQVESYLHYQGSSFIKRFDANSYLYITKAMDYFDFTSDKKSLEKVLENVKSRFLVIAFSSDWLFPPYQSKEIVRALRMNDIEVSYCEIDSSHGHDAFLLEKKQLTMLISNFLYY